MVEAPEDLPHAFAAAWMARDAGALARLCTADADFVNVVGLWWRDRAAIERAHHYGLTTFFRNSELSVRRVEVRRLGDRVAVVHARMRLSGQIAPDGTVAEDRQTILIFVCMRGGEGWQAVAVQNTDIVPGAETHLRDGDGFRPQDYR
ncbi:SgcJ/EcaC family oxidoreductase [Roseobacter sp. HKCCA0434]|uniref:SgcJ/EcaC family oxidoreductase n=1 Tax=Roseobacter sp. HKCCA0434 TaxID=3079297 RepID=UPI002905D745|nr:SgcJ/EcaC family oxidoreductase [Roseobacter sp. HKCCA0434]